MLTAAYYSVHWLPTPGYTIICWLLQHSGNLPQWTTDSCVLTESTGRTLASGSPHIAMQFADCHRLLKSTFSWNCQHTDIDVRTMFVNISIATKLLITVQNVSTSIYCMYVNDKRHTNLLRTASDRILKPCPDCQSFQSIKKRFHIDRKEL